MKLGYTIVSMHEIVACVRCPDGTPVELCTEVGG
jgi:hypothetical protein